MKSTVRTRDVGMILVLALVLGVMGSGSQAGELQPPMGPITSTMKPLDAIEPRICVNDLPAAPDAVHHISASGTYILAEDVVGQSQSHGILIDAPNVKLDLNGFSLLGVLGSLSGVQCSAAVETIEICVGYSDNYLSVVSGWGGGGIVVTSARAVTLANLRIENNGADGANIGTLGHVDHGSRVVIRNVSSSGNGGAGVRLRGLTDSRTYRWRMVTVDATGNASDGCSVDIPPSADLDFEARGGSCVSNGGGGFVYLFGGFSTARVRVMDFGLSRNAGDNLSFDVQDRAEVRVEKFNVRQQFGQQAGTRVNLGDNVNWDFLGTNCVYSNNAGDGFVMVTGTGCRGTKKWLASNFRLNGFGGGGGSGGSILLGADSSLSLLAGRCVFDGNAGDGLAMVESGGCSCEQILFDCSMSGNGGGGLGGAGGRMIVSAGSSLTMTGNSIQTNNNATQGFWIGAAGPDPVFREGVVDIILTRCVANGNGDTGFLADNAHCTFDGCSAMNNGGWGIELLSTAALMKVKEKANKTKCSNNLRGGMSAQGGGAGGTIRIKDSLFNDNTGDGLNFRDIDSDNDDIYCGGNAGNGILQIGGDLTVSGGTLRANGGHGASYSGGAGGGGRVVVRATSSSGNGLTGIRCEDGSCWVSDSDCSGNGTNGMEFDLCRVTCKNSSSTGNACTGVLMIGSSGTFERSNSCDNDCDGYGTTAGSDDLGRVILCECTHLACDSSGNALDGFSLADCVRAEVTGCSASSNGGSGVHVLASSEPSIVDNTKCMNNGGFAVLVDGLGATVVRCIAAGNISGGYSVPVPGNSLGRVLFESDLLADVQANPMANTVR